MQSAIAVIHNVVHNDHEWYCRHCGKSSNYVTSHLRKPVCVLATCTNDKCAHVNAITIPLPSNFAPSAPESASRVPARPATSTPKPPPMIIRRAVVAASLS